MFVTHMILSNKHTDRQHQTQHCFLSQKAQETSTQNIISSCGTLQHVLVSEILQSNTV